MLPTFLALYVPCLTAGNGTTSTVSEAALGLLKDDAESLQRGKPTSL